MIWHMPTATALACFALAYVRPGQWLTRSVLIGLSIPAADGRPLSDQRPAPLGLARTCRRRRHPPGLCRAGAGSSAPMRWPWLWSKQAFGWLFVHSPQHRARVDDAVVRGADPGDPAVRHFSLAR
ncbi:MAG: hypothetical protein R2838_25630 [Caldilineaceae bacterium]